MWHFSIIRWSWNKRIENISFLRCETSALSSGGHGILSYYLRLQADSNWKLEQRAIYQLWFIMEIVIQTEPRLIGTYLVSFEFKLIRITSGCIYSDINWYIKDEIGVAWFIVKLFVCLESCLLLLASSLTGMEMKTCLPVMIHLLTF